MSNLVVGKEARQALNEAINLVAEAVEGTLGPSARTVLVTGKDRPPQVLNDGVKIVNSVRSDDPAVQAGVELFRQVAREAQQASGDGTTTATLLARAICNQFFDSENPFRDAEKLDKFLLESQTYLKSIVKEIDMEDEELTDLQTVATIASNNDSVIGELITDMFQEIGSDGLVNLKVSATEHCYWENTIGCEIPTTYVSPMLCNTRKRTFEHDNPLFLITTESIEEFDDLTPALEVAIENNRPLIIVCQDIKGVALSNLIANVVGGVVKAVAVKIPRTDPQEWYDDIQSIVGGKVFFSSEKGTGISSATTGEGDFGSCERIVIDENSMVIVAGNVTEQLKNHLVGLKEQAEKSSHSFHKEKFLTRIARLESSMASIYIGGFSEAEIRETRERVDDAVNATRLALKGGVVVGGGWALSWLLQHFQEYHWLNTPAVTLMKNSWSNDASNFTADTMNYNYKFDSELYFNAKTKCYESINEAKVLDPYLVTLNSLKAAVSIARLMLLTDKIVLSE